MRRILGSLLCLLLLTSPGKSQQNVRVTAPVGPSTPQANSLATVVNNALNAGTSGVPGTDVLTIQGIGGMTPVLTQSIGGSVSSITGWAGGTLGAMSGYGTSPGPVLVPGVNAAVTNGAAAGAAGSASTDVMTVQGITGMTPVAVTPDPSANVAKETGGNLAAILSAVQGPVPAGTNMIGHVIVDSGGGGGSSTGNVGALTNVVCVAPTVTSSTYSANNVMGNNAGAGTALVFSNLFTTRHSGTIQSVVLNFTTVQTVGFLFFPFASNPTNTTWTDHAVAAINSADVFAMRGPVSLANPASNLGTHTVYNSDGIGKAFVSADTNLYGILVPTATTATTGGTTNVVEICVKVLQDN